MDKLMTVEVLKENVSRFVNERDWQQFHTPKNLSTYLAIEAAELMEIFQWVESQESVDVLEARREEVEHEIADCFFILLSFCNRYSIDIADALESKIKLNAKKYPVDKSRGTAVKYTKL